MPAHRQHEPNTSIGKASGRLPNSTTSRCGPQPAGWARVVGLPARSRVRHARQAGKSVDVDLASHARSTNRQWKVEYPKRRALVAGGIAGAHGETVWAEGVAGTRSSAPFVPFLVGGCSYPVLVYSGFGCPVSSRPVFLDFLPRSHTHSQLSLPVPSCLAIKHPWWVLSSSSASFVLRSFRPSPSMHFVLLPTLLVVLTPLAHAAPLLASLTSILLGSRDSAPYPDPLQGTSNVDIRDPTILFNQALGQYEIAGTGPNVPVWTAPTLNGPWSQSDNGVLNGPSKINLAGRDGPWAPDLKYVDGKYYAWYSVSSFSTQKSAIGVAVSDSGRPDSFTDYGQQIRTSDGDAPNALDPNLVITDEGQFLSYGSYYGGIFLARLNSPSSVDTSSLPGTHIAGGGGRPTEGSFIYTSNGAHYLFVSQGQCCNFDQKNLPAYNTTEYKVLVGKASSVQGPYYDRDGNRMTAEGAGTVLLSSFDHYYAPGGQSVYFDERTGRDVMVFHYSNPKDANAPAKLGIYVSKQCVPCHVMS